LLRAFQSVNLLAVVLTLTAPLFASSIFKLGVEEAAPPLPIDEWLSQGERRQFRCDLRISRPTLTFQQRYGVFIKVKLPAPSLQRESVQRDLHFFVKVADENGKWFAGQTYNHFKVEKKFDKKVDLIFESALYLQPGSFTIAVVVYDAVLREHNVTFRRVTVKPPKNDPLPTLLTSVPKVEFPSDSVEGVAPLGSGHAALPVVTDRPVELDVIVDLTPYAAGTVITAGPDPASDTLASTSSVSKLLDGTCWSWYTSSSRWIFHARAKANSGWHASRCKNLPKPAAGGSERFERHRYQKRMHAGDGL
jgi:hypothetical protein